MQFVANQRSSSYIFFSYDTQSKQVIYIFHYRKAPTQLYSLM